MLKIILILNFAKYFLYYHHPIVNVYAKKFIRKSNNVLEWKIMNVPYVAINFMKFTIESFDIKLKSLELDWTWYILRM